MYKIDKNNWDTDIYAKGLYNETQNVIVVHNKAYIFSTKCIYTIKLGGNEE